MMHYIGACVADHHQAKVMLRAGSDLECRLCNFVKGMSINHRVSHNLQDNLWSKL